MIFLFPTELEARKFRLACPTAEVIICGVGMAAAAATMATLAQQLSPQDHSQIVILAGIAGSYDTSRHPINNVYEVESERIHELPPQFTTSYKVPLRWGLPAVNSNSVNSTNATHIDTDIENMEGAAVMAICNAIGINFSEIRAISNRVGAPTAEWSIESATDALTNVLSTIYNQ